MSDQPIQKPQRTTREVIRDQRQQAESWSLKVVKQLWILNGYDATEARTAAAKEEVAAKLYPFLADLAKWVIDCEKHSEQAR